MFTIYQKRVGNRTHDTYFRYREAAREQLKRDLQARLAKGWTCVGKTDTINQNKGLSEYAYDLITPYGENATLALLDGYFEDETIKAIRL